MKRRLTIAAALVHEPAILFLDEPTIGLDVHSARSLRGLIRDLNQSGVTVFLTTHLIAEAEQLAHRVGIIVRGRLIALDRPAGLRSRVQGESALELVTSDPGEELLAALAALPAVSGLSRLGDMLHLAIHSVDQALYEVAETTRRLGARVLAIRTVTPSLADAFVELTHLDVEAMQGATAPQKGAPQ